jgi:hypothetical protein
VRDRMQSKVNLAWAIHQTGGTRGRAGEGVRTAVRSGGEARAVHGRHGPAVRWHGVERGGAWAGGMDAGGAGGAWVGGGTDGCRA